MNTFVRNTTQETRADRRVRAGTVVAAVLAALAVWGAAELVLGIDLQAPAPAEGGDGFDIGVSAVVLTSGLAGLAGWGLLAVLERFTARAYRIWTAAALVVLVGSLAGPLSGTGVSVANRVALVLIHVLVGAVLIPALARTSRARVSPTPPTAEGADGGE